MYDIIIVGAGISGMTAAIYGRRASKSVLILEVASYGGQIVNTASVENYPAAPNISGFDLATEIYNQAKALGTEFKFEKVLEIKDLGTEKSVATKKNTYIGKTVILATGSENRKLGLENEDTLIGKGISYCATCDGAFYKNKTVAVVGGGNTALEDALYLSDIAEKVYIIDKVPLLPEYQDNKIESVQFDLTNENYSIFDHFSDIDGLMITAGFGKLALFENIPEEMIATYFNVNTIAVIRIIKHFYGKLLSKDDFYCGVMVSIACIEDLY